MERYPTTSSQSFMVQGIAPWHVPQSVQDQENFEQQVLERLESIESKLDKLLQRLKRN